MKTTTAWVSTILVATLATGGVIYASNLNSDNRGTVTRVIDGDTVDMQIAGNETRVRLLNIDTPETLDPNKPVECLGPEASDHLKSLLKPGDKVKLKYDLEREDRYGRTLAAVFKDDEFINRSIAAAGLGVAVKFEPNTKYYQEILDAQQAAQDDNAGLFSTNISCTIPARVTGTVDQLAQVPTDAADTAQEAASSAELAAAAVAAGVATGKALEANTADTHPVTAILLATTFKKSVTMLSELTSETKKVEAQHTRQQKSLAAKEKEQKKKAAEAKAKKQAEEEAKREAAARAKALAKAEERAAEQRAEQQKAAARHKAAAPKYAAPKKLTPRTSTPKYVAPKRATPKVQTPPKSSVPKNYNGPRCYAPGGKTWKPCG
ncbi:thermonuclease family protein [Glutamicibacter sp. JC586]|uniref:thermonuclease family protein n=1 Tax=Glutamicibacter sp. JC586 TaxID=2590552 RepID=UPI0013570896|nr:thermonuclease family protein [Glutamicibacter sp. JC586]